MTGTSYVKVSPGGIPLRKGETEVEDEGRNEIPLGDAHCAIKVACISKKHAMMVETCRSIDTVKCMDAESVPTGYFYRRWPGPPR